LSGANLSLNLTTNVAADATAIYDRLVKSGMSTGEARAKEKLFAKVLAQLDRLADAAPQGTASADLYLAFVPGRIEVLGKHTDYAGGKSLLATVERGFCIAALPRSDETIRIADASTGAQAAFEFSPDLVVSAGHWSNYPMTVARRVARNFPGPRRGADIAFYSDLPLAAGMSSSSALIVGIFKALAHINRLAECEAYQTHLGAPEALAGYLATIENGKSFGPLGGDRGVGTFGGSEDHTAICCCRPGHLELYAFCPVRREGTIVLPAGYTLAVGASGVLAEKTGEAMAKYNRASRLVSALLDLWQRATGREDLCLADAVHSAADAPDVLRQIIADEPHEEFDARSLSNRLEQFLGENERIIPAATEALAEGGIDRFGSLVDESQHLAAQLLENQVPQTIRLARLARECGAQAASAFGAGFGGSVWALVKAAKAEDFLAAWAACYREEFPAEAERSSFFSSAPGPSLIEL